MKAMRAMRTQKMVSRAVTVLDTCTIKVPEPSLKPKHLPGKAAERARRLCKIRLCHLDKTRLMMFQMLFWKQYVSNLYLCAIKSLGILPKLQKNARNYSNIEQIFFFHLSLTKYYEQCSLKTLFQVYLFSRYISSVLFEGKHLTKAQRSGLKQQVKLSMTVTSGSDEILIPSSIKKILSGKLLTVHVYLKCVLFSSYLPSSGFISAAFSRVSLQYGH